MPSTRQRIRSSGPLVADAEELNNRLPRSLSTSTARSVRSSSQSMSSSAKVVAGFPQELAVSLGPL
jgi:hypothetical protein